MKTTQIKQKLTQAYNLQFDVETNVVKLFKEIEEVCTIPVNSHLQELILTAILVKASKGDHDARDVAELRAKVERHWASFYKKVLENSAIPV